MSLYIGVALLLSFILDHSFGQLIIPKRPLGYVYNGGSNDAPIHLDIHIDPLCYDCKIAFPTVLEVARYYGASTLKLTSHVFPLPFHRQSYLTAIAAQAISNLSSVDTVYKWFEKIYNEKMTLLYTSVTKNMTAEDITRMLAGFAGELCINESEFITVMAYKDLERQTRTAWKYSCTRGVANTPTYFLNGVPLTADTKWKLKDWREVIDPLLGRQKESKKCCSRKTGTNKKMANKEKCCKTEKRRGCCRHKSIKQRVGTTNSFRSIMGRLFK